MDLGKKIIEMRKNSKLSQEQLAEKLDVTRQTISNWENGKFYPDIDALVKISKFFNISTANESVAIIIIVFTVSVISFSYLFYQIIKKL